MTPSAQRAVAVKKRGLPTFTARTLALLLSCALVCVSVTARAQDGGVPDDAPLAIRMTCGLCLNKPAEVKLDDELKRLQALERTHNDENWLGVVGTSVVVGLVVGLGAGLAIGLAVK